MWLEKNPSLLTGLRDLAQRHTPSPLTLHPQADISFLPLSNFQYPFGPISLSADDLTPYFTEKIKAVRRKVPQMLKPHLLSSQHL